MDPGHGTDGISDQGGSGEGHHVGSLAHMGSMERLFHQEDLDEVNIEEERPEIGNRHMDMDNDKTNLGATFY